MEKCIKTGLIAYDIILALGCFAASSRASLIVHDRCFGISVAKAGRAGTVGVGRDRRLGAGVYGIAKAINRLAGSGIASICPYDVGDGGSGHDVDVIADELLLQVVVAGAVGIRRGRADPDRRTKGQSTYWRLGVVVVVGLHPCLPGVVCRGLCQRIKGKVNDAVRGNADLWKEGMSARSVGKRPTTGQVGTIEHDG